MIAKLRTPLKDLLFSLQQIEQRSPHSTTAVLAGRRVTVESDDLDFLSDFFTVFGGSEPVSGSLDIPSDIHIDVRAKLHPDFGWFRMSGSNDLPIDAKEFSVSIWQDDGMFERFPVDEAGWECVAFRGSKSPAFAFHGRDCIFELAPQWRRVISYYLFLRLLRMRADAIFFHASALGILGEGTIFVGPSGRGKSTTSLALAARGHDFLSDETAGYIPDSGELIPVRRPVGIKSGPRASAVARGLAPALVERIARDGFLRVDIETLFRVKPPRATPLRRVVFLRGFRARPSLERITPGREEIIELQPWGSSFLNASHSRRVFQLARLLSSVKVYQLHPGDPDATAEYLEEKFACEQF